MKTFRLGSVVIAGFFFVNAAEAQTTRAVQRGETIVQTYCAQCHAVGKTDTSALPPGIRRCLGSNLNRIKSMT